MASASSSTAAEAQRQIEESHNHPEDDIPPSSSGPVESGRAVWQEYLRAQNQTRTRFHRQVGSPVSTTIRDCANLNLDLYLRKFERFPDLPPELRLDIFRKAAQMPYSRIVEVQAVEITGPTGQDEIHISASPRTPQPRQITATCSDGQTAVNDLHNVHFKGQSPKLHSAEYQGSLNFDFDRDILYFNARVIQPCVWKPLLLPVFVSGTAAGTLKMIRVVAINCDWHFDRFPEGLEQFTGLELLILVIGRGLPRSTPAYGPVWKELTGCERSYFGGRIKAYKAFDAWLKEPLEPEASGYIPRRKIWLVHARIDTRQDHCCYGRCWRSDQVYHRQVQLDPDRLEARDCLEFSDSRRTAGWWRRKKWIGAIELSKDGEIAV